MLPDIKMIPIYFLGHGEFNLRKRELCSRLHTELCEQYRRKKSWISAFFDAPSLTTRAKYFYGTNQIASIRSCIEKCLVIQHQILIPKEFWQVFVF